MKGFYLVDFENVNNGGIENIDMLPTDSHVHIFSTKNALNIRMDLFLSKKIDITAHIVPSKKESLDMHLVSYLGYLIGIHGDKCKYIIISNDKDYDNIIKFWINKGISNINRESKIILRQEQRKKVTDSGLSTGTQVINSTINVGMDYTFSGEDRSELNIFVQHGLLEKGYDKKNTNKICKYVIAHCNDDRMLSGIHNDLKGAFSKYSEIYDDVKDILAKFAKSKSKVAKKESKIRSFFGQHFKKKLYTENKEEIIEIIMNAETRQQVNNELMKLYADGKVVSHIYKTVQPLIEELPGK